MGLTTTWPYRRAAKPVSLLRRLADRLTRTDTTVDAPTGETPTTGGPTLDDYAGLPAEGQIGFERSTYSFTLEVGETAQPTPRRRVIIGSVTARTAGYESPSGYSLEEVPAALNMAITDDGVLVWIADNYPTYAEGLFPSVPSLEGGIGPVSLLVGATLRGQRARAYVSISPQPLPRYRQRDSLAVDAVRRPTANSQDAGWTYAQPVAVPLPSLNFSGVITALRTAWDIGYALILFNRPKVDNPFRTDDIATLSIGGVIVRPGYIPLKDVFIHRVSDEFIREYRVTIDDPNLRATTKPWCPRIEDVGDDAARLANVRAAYGQYVVWWPIHAHFRNIEAHLTVTAVSIFGDEYEVTWLVSSININTHPVPLGDSRIDDSNIPTGNTLELGDLRMPLALGIDQSEHWLFTDDPDTAQLSFNLGLLPSYRNRNQRFIDVVSQELDIFAAGKGRLLDFVVRGKLMAWQIAWATDSDSGAYYLWPETSSLYQYAPGEAWGLVAGPLVGTQKPPTDHEFRGTIGTGTVSGVLRPDDENNVAESLGPHLKIKAHSTGWFSIRASDSPGATIVQIMPVVHEWYAWAIPIPGLGGVLGRLLGRIVNAVGSRIGFQRGIRESAEFVSRLATGNNATVLGTATSQIISSTAKIAQLQTYRRLVNRVSDVATNTGASAAMGISTSKATQQFTDSQRISSTADTEIEAGGFANLGQEGLTGPPVVAGVHWRGDYVCGRFITLPSILEDNGDTNGGGPS